MRDSIENIVNELELFIAQLELDIIAEERAKEEIDNHEDYYICCGKIQSNKDTIKRLKRITYRGVKI